MAAGAARAETVDKKKSINTGLFTGSPAADQAVRSQYVKPSGNADFDQAIETYYDVVPARQAAAPRRRPADRPGSENAVSVALTGEKTPEQALADAQTCRATGLGPVPNRKALTRSSTARGWDRGHTIGAEPRHAAVGGPGGGDARSTTARNPWPDSCSSRRGSSASCVFTARRDDLQPGHLVQPLQPGHATRCAPAGLANYAGSVRRPEGGHSRWATRLFYAVMAVPLEIVLRAGPGLAAEPGAAAAPAFSAPLFYLPKMTPAVATASIFLLLLNGNTGAINQVLGLFGIQGPQWLIDPAWVKPSIVLMTLWGVSGTMVIFLAALKNVPRELYEVARSTAPGRSGSSSASPCR